ncbi:sulfurtransferase [Nocardioides donggukensis]|uniref:Sulfurtransferase n=1 Tax=Nocardioides donggukensis TaxID=2774019 RepID=A0A927PZ66_9ACTN|nr:sulfurtransferase [Nocardioides donggukensis]MBD8869638.1 sulfurtransferase [Nocardioides donggukensis]
MSSGPLVGAADLVAELGDGTDSSAPTVLDVRWRLGGPAGPEEFARGHVPGARYVDLESALAGSGHGAGGGAGAGGRHPLPDPETFQAAMRAAGVEDHRPVVVYDDWSGLAAARAWWLLRHHGHDDVRLLDGGWPAWQRAGGAVETGADPDAAPAGGFTARPGRMPVVDAEGVPAVAEGGRLLDARAPERFRGETEPVDPVPGHIPGAVNLPATATLAEDGTLRPAQEIRRLAEQAGTSGKEVAAYCGSGVTAAHLVLALEVAGIRAALYPGSWSGWISDPTRPVARGDSPGGA